MEYYSNMKRSDHKGRRVAIFGTINKDELFIQVYTCSKQDFFSKNIAREAFLHQLPSFHPKEFLIKLDDVNRPKWSFLRWCKAHYPKLKRVYINIPGKPQKLEVVNTNLSQPHNVKVTYLR